MALAAWGEARGREAGAYDAEEKMPVMNAVAGDVCPVVDLPAAGER